MTCEEEPTICIMKTRELLSKAQLLMSSIEELLDLCTSPGPSNQRRCRMIGVEARCRIRAVAQLYDVPPPQSHLQKQEREASVEEDGETLVIDGFRFESAVSREDLRRLRPPAGRGGGGLSDGHRSGLITQGQQGQRAGRGNWQTESQPMTLCTNDGRQADN